jgi:hypothetical protein
VALNPETEPTATAGKLIEADSGPRTAHAEVAKAAGDGLAVRIDSVSQQMVAPPVPITSLARSLKRRPAIAVISGHRREQPHL